MKYLLILFFVQASISTFAQSMATPAINANRRLDRFYIDSLTTKARSNITDLNKYPASAKLDSVRLEFYFFLGEIYRLSTKQKDSLLIVGNQLLEFSKQKKNIKYQIKAHLLLEYYHRAVTQNYTEALRENYEILALLEGSKEEKEKNLWKTDYNLGTLLYYIERYDESIVYLKKALADFGSDKNSGYLQRASIHQRLGESYKFNKQLDKALESYLMALSILETNKNKVSSGYGYVYNDIGVTLKHLKRYDEAIENFNQAAFHWQKIGGNDGLASAWANMADAMFYAGQYEEATLLSLKVLKTSTTFINVVKANEVLANVYEAKKEYEKSLFYRKIVFFKQDSSRKAKKISEVSALLLKTEREKFELKAEQERQLSQQNLLILQQKEQFNTTKNENEKKVLIQEIENNKLKRLLDINQLSVDAQRKERIQQSTIKQLKINELNQKLDLQNRKRLFLYAGILAIGLIGVLLLWFNVQLRNKNKQLTKKNAEIETALLRGQTTERKRIASELHDNLNSLLASVKVSVQAIMPATAKDKKVVDTVLKMVDNATNEVRQISHNMLPFELEKEGFSHALVALAMRLNLNRKTFFSLKLDALNHRFSPEIEFNLYMICLELCQNITKHAEATQAAIEFEIIDNQLIMFVWDNGKGFDKTKIEEGMGMKNIQHRAKSIGANLRVQSHEDGTTFWVKIPVSQLAHI